MQYNFSNQKIKRFYLLLFVFLLPVLGLAQQIGQIDGKVFTMDGKPLSYASIKLKSTGYGTSVTTEGHYSFSAPAGNYTLVISYANYTIHETPIRVIANKTIEVPTVTVPSQSNQLREVIVSDIQRNKFARKESADIARMPLGNLQNAQAYSVVTKELMQELGATDFNAAMSQVAGSVTNVGVNDNGSDLFLRGFNAKVGLRNSLPSFPRSANEIFNLERVEVLKGPSATLFGAQASSYGGVINTITKKPFESFRGEVGYTTGSWGMNRVTADINTPLNADRTALARFNVLGTTQNGFQDAGRQQAFGFAASLLFKANDRTTVSFDADIYAPEKTLMAYNRNTEKLTYGTMDKVPLPYLKSLISDDISTARFGINVGTELAYKISDNWVSRTSYQFNQSGDKESIFFVPTYLNDNQILRRYRIFDRLNLTYNSLQQNFTGDYFIANVKNTLVAGIDYSFYKDTDQSMSPYFLTYDTVGIADPHWKPISRADIVKSRAAQSPGDAYSTTGYKNLSGYLSNVTNIDDRLFVMLSLRVNRYMGNDSYSFTPNKDPKKNSASTLEGYNQTSVSPKFGLVYQPIKGQLSIFANYMNSFRNMGASQGLANDKDLSAQPVLMNWKPEQANQYEFGAKGEFFEGRINTTISYYNIDVTNTLRQVLQNVSVQDGKLRSQGFEFDFIANPITGWNIILGYGYNDIKYVKSIEANMNKRKNWAPKHVANAWTSYKFLQGSLQGFGLGAGVNYVDKVYLDIQEVFAVPSYTTYNATAFYDKPKYRVGVKLNNLSDIKYWDIFGKPQKPFEILANLSFKF